MRLLQALFAVLTPLYVLGATASNQLVDPTLEALAHGPNAQLRATDKTGSGFTKAVGDFDGDGRADYAALKLSNPGGETFNLVVALSGEGGQERVLRTGDNIQAVGISSVKAGSHKTACSKGAGAAASDCKADVRLEHDGISLFTFESADTLLYIEHGSFKEIAIAD